MPVTNDPDYNRDAVPTTGRALRDIVRDHNDDLWDNAPRGRAAEWSKVTADELIEMFGEDPEDDNSIDPMYLNHLSADDLRRVAKVIRENLLPRLEV